MAEIVIDPTEVSLIESHDQMTLPVTAVMDAGTVIEIASTGYATAVDDTVLGRVGVTIRNANNPGDNVTVIFDGTIYLGAALDGMAYGDLVYVSAVTPGDMADAVGAGAITLGHVVPVWGQTTPKNALRLISPLAT